MHYQINEGKIFVARFCINNVVNNCGILYKTGSTYRIDFWISELILMHFCIDSEKLYKYLSEDAAKIFNPFRFEYFYVGFESYIYEGNIDSMITNSNGVKFWLIRDGDKTQTIRAKQ